MNQSPNDVVIVDALRTPFAKAGTKLAGVHASELGRIALSELIAKTELDVNEVDEVIIGNTGCPSDAVNISRVVALRAGLPLGVSAHTVHRNCASALQSITSGFDKIKAGVADVVIAGGTESMSQLPLIHTKEFQNIFGEFAFSKTLGKKLGALKKLKLKHLKPRISVVEGLTDPFCGINMGQTAEVLAKEFGISRKEQDEFALMSHQRAVAAQENGRLAEEITPVFLAPKYKKIISEDIGPRKTQNMESLGKLRPYFDRRYGTITVGNACPLTDGAAMMLLMSRKKAEELGYKPMASISSYAYAGLDPKKMGLGPAYSTPKALKLAGLELKDMGAIELNEAFAAQVIACEKAMASDSFCQKELGLSKAVGQVDRAKLNVNGGAIALGHPVGTTGTRLVMTLMHELKNKKLEHGLATLCIGGGQGGALVLKNEVQ